MTARGVHTQRRNFLINLALLLVSSFVALSLGEITLRLMGYSPMYVSPERAQFWKYDALLGWAHQPGQAGLFVTPQFQTQVHINEQGLRDREHSFARLPGTQRILVLGDSFAWGYGVEESERFSQGLETALGVEVVNAGVSGYSTDQELLWFQHEGIQYDFDLVVLVLTGNDVGDNERQLVNTIYYKPRFVQAAGGLVLTGYPVPRTSLRGRLVYNLSQRSALAYFVVQRYFDLLSIYRQARPTSDATAGPDGAAGPAAQPFELTIALLHEMSTLAEAKGARFVIVANSRWWNGPRGATYTDFIDALQAEGFLVLDVEAQPGFEPGQMLIPNDGHWSKAGHAFVADQLIDLVEGQGLLGRSHASRHQPGR